jgi:hypothetical protein
VDPEEQKTKPWTPLQAEINRPVAVLFVSKVLFQSESTSEPILAAA